MLKTYATAAALAVAGSLAFSSASAATFTGQDLTGVLPGDSSTWSNSNAARADFLAELGGVGSENFDDIVGGTVPPIALDFPGSLGSSISASLTNSGVVMSEPDRGRFATSGTNYYQVITGNDFQIDFTTDVAAFGFYGTDIGDFDGQLFIEFLDENENILFSEEVGIANATDGNILFYGRIDETNPFRSVRFSAVGGNDGFGFDDMIVGDFGQVGRVPLPAAGWLLLSGVAGIAGLRRFGRKA